MAPRFPPYNIRLDADLRDRGSIVAENEYLTLPQLMRRLLDEYCTKKGHPSKRIKTQQDSLNGLKQDLE